MSMQRHAGFTLLEMLIAVSIIAILMAIAVPSFDYVNNRIIAKSQVENLQRSLSMARQTALTKNRQTIVCPSGNGNTCSNDNDWSYGFMVFVDKNRDEAFSAAEDQLIEYVAGVRNVATRQDTSSFTHTLKSSRTSEVIFSGQGDAAGTNQTFTFCDGQQQKRFELTVSNTGRTQVKTLVGESCS
jgi:type IV fimbrial biogenesis protein FimT